jgi:putative nucleotidyltransferase-like protein
LGPVKDARLLARLLANPSNAERVEDWASLLSVARAESLIGSLAWQLASVPLPEKVAQILEVARRDSEQVRTQALWEAEMARRALAPLGVPVVLLKGTAYAAANLTASVGRSIGDLDILVPRASLDAVQAALLAAGWEWVKEDEYDDLYYRRWMHELPPLIHKERDRMIDVHHNILPLTARPTPDAAALIADSDVLDNGVRVLWPPDMVIHSAAHLFADGDLAGGLRNLWDIDRLLREFSSADPDSFWEGLHGRASRHGLLAAVQRAARLANHLYMTPVPESWRTRDSADPLFEVRLLARNGWGQATRPALRFAFYVRSHWLRMPPLMLARHLWTKARCQFARSGKGESQKSKGLRRP